MSKYIMVALMGLAMVGCADSKCDSSLRDEGGTYEHTSVICQHPDGTSTVSKYFADGQSIVVRTDLDGNMVSTISDGKGLSHTSRLPDAFDPHAASEMPHPDL